MKLRINRINVFSTILLLLTLVMLAITVTLTIDIRVLANWSLVLPAGDIHAGDTIVIQSIYGKLRPITGTATRYIECNNTQGVTIRYKLNDAVADSAPGHTGTGVVLQLPTQVFIEKLISKPLPTICSISLSVRYPVYPWHPVYEFAQTKSFTLLSAATSTTSAQSTTRTSQPLASDPSQTSSTSNASSSSSQSISATQPNQSDVSQQPATTTQPSLVKQIVQKITGLL